MKLYKELAQLVIARQNCIDSKNSEWEEIHEKKIALLVAYYLPQGSGFNHGTTINFKRSKENYLVFESKYFPMNEAGFYDGQVLLNIVVKPSLAFDIDVSVRCADNLSYYYLRKYSLKEYFTEIFQSALLEEAEDIT